MSPRRLPAVSSGPPAMKLALVLLLLLAPFTVTSGTVCSTGRWVPSANRMIYPARHVFIPNPACHR